MAASTTDPSGTESYRVGGPPTVVLLPFLGLFILVGAVFWVTAIRNANVFLGGFLALWTGIGVSNARRFVQAPRRVELTPTHLRFIRRAAANVEIPWSSLTSVTKSRSGWRWKWTDGNLVMPFPPEETYRLLRSIEQRAPHVEFNGV